MDVVNTSQENKRKDVTEYATVSNKQVKKHESPLGAVEQKAKLEGIDMSLVLSPSSDAEEMDGDSKKNSSIVSDDEGEEGNEKKPTASIPETLVKKYKRMFKAGVPMDRVQQLDLKLVHLLNKLKPSLCKQVARTALLRGRIRKRKMIMR